MRDGHHNGRDNLAVCPHVFDAVVVAFGAGVDVAEELGVVGDDIAGDALEEPELEVSPPFAGVGPGEVTDGVEETLLGLDDAFLRLDFRAGGYGVGVAFDVGVVGFLFVWVCGSGGGVFGAGVDVAVGVFVVVCQGPFALMGAVERRVFHPEEGSDGEVVEADTGVLHDEAAPEVGPEEDVADEETAEEAAENNTNSPAGTERLDVGGGWGFDGDEEGEDATGQGNVEGDEAQRPLERVTALEDAVLEGAEDDGRETTGNARGDTPGGGGLGDTSVGPLPGDIGLGREANTDQCTDDALGRGNRPSEEGCSSQPGSRANLSAAHGKHEGAGVGGIFETVGGDDAGLDGVGDATTQGHSTDELCYGGHDTDVPHLQGACGDRGGVRVGDIVGTVASSTEHKGDRRDGQDPVILGREVAEVLSIVHDSNWPCRTSDQPGVERIEELQRRKKQSARRQSALSMKP